MSVSRMCSSKSSGRSCRVLPRAMGAFCPVPTTAVHGARRHGLTCCSTGRLTKPARRWLCGLFNRSVAGKEPDTATVLVQAVASLDGFIARPDDLPGPIFDWYEAGSVEGHFNDPEHTYH